MSEIGRLVGEAPTFSHTGDAARDCRMRAADQHWDRCRYGESGMLRDKSKVGSFTEFFEQVEPRLRNALLAERSLCREEGESGTGRGG